MKKILSGLILLSLLFVLVTPMMVSAVDAPEEVTKCKITHDFSGWGDYMSCPASGDCLFDSTTYDCPMCCTINAIYTVTDWIFIGIMSLVVIFVLFGAFTILTAGGAAEKINTGRNYIIWACVGVIVAAMAKIIPSIVKAILQVS